jgi:hypothetical protein
VSDLKELREKMEAAERTFRGLGMMNTVGLTTGRQIELDIEYQRAIQAYADALQAYQAAIAQAAMFRGISAPTGLIH